MCEFWYDYVKPKYGYGLFHRVHENRCIYKDIAEDVETRFDTSNYGLECNPIERLLPKGKNKKE